MCGAQTGERNNTLFKIACQCLHAGYSQDDVEKALVARAVADGLSESEARKTVESAFDREQRAPPHGCVGPRTAPSQAASSTPGPPPKPKQPVLQPLPTPIANGFVVLLEMCFKPGEKIVLGKGSYNSEGKLNIDGGVMNSREAWRKRCLAKSIEQQYAQHADGIFLRINPMRANGKSDVDVATWRHCLVEFDLDRRGKPISKELQYAILIDSGRPIAAIIDSANKSLQALVKVDARNRKEYDERCEEVAAYFSQFEGFDSKNKNPSRYCRCPGVVRNLYQDGKLIEAARQELLVVNVGPASWEEYEKSQELSEEELLRLTVERADYYSEKTQPFPEPMGEEAYYGIAGEVVSIIKPNTEACPEGILTQFLLGMMNIIGRKPYCRQAGIHHLNEFVVLVGETSIGAKGTSWDAANVLLEAVDSDWFNNRIHGGVQSGRSHYVGARC